MKNNRQLTHKEHQPSKNKFPLRIVADNITKPGNVGSLFRLCDAMGIEKLYLCGDTAIPPNAKINKTSRSTEKHVDYEHHSNTEDLVTKLKSAGYLIASLEITTTSIAINSPSFVDALDDNQPVCLILGSENTGVNQALLNLSDITTHIPMHGNNSSMNVISAASIACYEITRRYK
ncbi:MAG: RNA methyltransferase [Thiotrichaceae bacterium]|nr:MAG: RNA methyltransferase [Thiotrichaceae bacterium]